MHVSEVRIGGGRDLRGVGQRDDCLREIEATKTDFVTGLSCVHDSKADVKL